MNLRLLEIGLPLILRSHMISLIKPMAPVVLASSKNTTVSSLSFIFLTDSCSAWQINLVISFSVMPPWTYIRKHKNLLLNDMIKNNDSTLPSRSASYFYFCLAWPGHTCSVSVLSCHNQSHPLSQQEYHTYIKTWSRWFEKLTRL